MKKRRVAALFLAAVMCGGLTACGSGSEAETTAAAAAAETQAAEAPEENSEEAAGEEAAPAGEQVILTWAEVNPIDSLDGQLAEFFRDKVAELSGNTIAIDIQASGVLGAESDVLDGITAGGGTVDMARISVFSLTNYGTELSVLPSVPFIFESRDHYWKFAESEIGQQILDEPSQLGLGVKGLFFVEEGFRNFFTKEEVTDISGMNGLKIRVSTDPILTGVVEQLGASPTVISFTELYSSLQTGVVDGADQPTALYESNAFNEVAPYLIEDEHTMSASEVIITEEAWNSLSADQQNAILEAGKQTSEYCKELSGQVEEESKARLIEKGVTFVEIEDKSPWREACEGIISEYTAGHEAEYQQILDLN